MWFAYQREDDLSFGGEVSGSASIRLADQREDDLAFSGEVFGCAGK
jgi:hypothetical protein